MTIKITKEEANIIYHALTSYISATTRLYIDEPDADKKEALEEMILKAENVQEKVFIDD